MTELPIVSPPSATQPARVSSALSWPKAALLTSPMCLLTLAAFFNRFGAATDWRKTAGGVVAYLFINAVFLLMLRSGKTSRYRRLFFVTLAFSFVLSFVTNLVETRGSMAVNANDMLRGDTPFCHIVVPTTIIPAVFTRTIIFPGTMEGGFANISSMLVMWLGCSLALGRGWCGWVCFFGGMDEGFSRIFRKARIRKINPIWTYLSFAVLSCVVLLSAATLRPAYCEWLCPYKAVTEFVAVTSPLILLQTIIFVGLFAGLVVILPMLTRKRAQCGLFCPMGAFQSAFNWINPFELRVDRTKCVDCNVCETVCPTFSVDSETVSRGKVGATCARCGECVDHCPKGAVAYHIRGTEIGMRPNLARLMYIYPAYLCGAFIGMGMIGGAVWRILRFVTTGSVF